MRTTLVFATLAVVLVSLVTACASGNVGSVDAIAIDGGDRTLVVGDVVALSATVTTTGGASTAITWNSDDDAVATVDASGLLSALAEGSAEVTAASTVDPTKTDTVTVTVDPAGALVWTRQVGTVENDTARAVAVDANGHVYAVGATEGALEGPNVGFSDAFLLAYDAGGAVRWSRQFGSTENDLPRGIATGGGDTVYVTGHTGGALDGPLIGGTDVFLRAYDESGSLRWVRQFGTSEEDIALAVAADADGNVYVAGYTAGDLGGTNAGVWDGFVQAYDPDGAFRWTRQFGTAAGDFATGIATDGDGNVYVVGSTSGALAGPQNGEGDVHVRAYDGNGDLRWAVQFGTTDIDYPYGVAADADGNVYVAGITYGSLEGVHAGVDDAFVRAYGTNGDLRWTRQFGTAGSDSALAVATDAMGNVFVGGATTGDLGSPNAGLSDAFVRAYAPDGDVRWTRQFGTGSNDSVGGVAADPQGTTYTAGWTRAALAGPWRGGQDAYVRKLGR